VNRQGCRSFIGLLVALALMADTVSPAFAAEALSLNTIVDAAMKNNPTVIEAQKRWEEKDNKILSAKSLANPQFGVMKDDIPRGSLLSPGQAMMTEFSFVQDIMNPAKLKLMAKMATNDAAMSKGNYEDKRLQVYVDAKQAYYDLLYASQALAIGKENQQLMGQLAKIAQVNYSTGMVPLQDTLRAQTEYSKMTTDLISMAGMEAVAKAKLNVLMGRQADSELSVAEEFNAPPPNFDLASLQATAVSTKPSIQGMQAQLTMAENGVQLAKKQASLPDFQLTLAYKDYRNDEMTPDTWKVGLMLMLPVWGGKNQADIRASAAGLEASKAALTNMKNMAGLDVQMALTEAQTSWRQIDLYKNTIMPQAEQSYQAAVVAYTNGKADFMAVLDGLNTLRNTKLAYYKARIDYEKAAANLEKAVGKPLFTNI
jgi:cobalt-zinc-cadmium efflux system outer membrane protein